MRRFSQKKLNISKDILNAVRTCHAKGFDEASTISVVYGFLVEEFTR